MLRKTIEMMHVTKQAAVVETDPDKVPGKI